MREIECVDQAEVNAAALAGDMAVVRSGSFEARDSAVVYASDSAVVYARGSACVDASGSARVYDGTVNVSLRRDRPRVVIGPIGSRNDSLGVSLPADGSDPYVYAGCWSGSLEEFEARVSSVYPTGRFGDEYRAAIAFIRAMVAHNTTGGE